jgi:hypothetical protein
VRIGVHTCKFLPVLGASDAKPDAIYIFDIATVKRRRLVRALVRQRK